MKYKYAIFTLLAGLLVSIYFVASKQYPLLPGYHAFHHTAARYQLKKEQNKRFFSQQQQATQQSATMLQKQFNSLIPFWLGTRYGFYGKTNMPGKGQIACGYFVAQVLQDLGYQLDRDAMAQAPSETMIKSLTQSSLIHRFSGITIQEFEQKIIAQGQGLYLVGLDTHTGFLLYDATGRWFLHASGRMPFAVVKERASESIVLSKSKYRVIGKISADTIQLAKRYL